jgi:hypothetical protein
LAELGITAAHGTAALKEPLKIIASAADERLPVDAHANLVVLAAALQAMQALVGSLERRIMAQQRWERGEQAGWRPSRASVSSGRLGSRRRSRTRRHSGRGAILRPGSGSCRARATGGKQKLGPMSKQGDYLSKQK